MEIVQLDAANNILLLGKDDDAAFYSIATLEQVLPQSYERQYTTVLFEDYANKQYRGMVEGFHGYPWTVEARPRLGLNSPRSTSDEHLRLMDLKGTRTIWACGTRSILCPSPRTSASAAFLTQDASASLAEESKKCNIDFVWVAHPAMQRQAR